MAEKTARDFIGTFAAIFAAIAVLLVVDTLLAKLDSKEARSHAVSEYDTGMQLMRAKRPAQAVEHLRIAVSLDRERPAYAIALASAVFASGRPRDAEALLKPVLEKNATSGAANLAMARMLAKEGRVEEAKAYYHRAIYGLWAEDTAANRAKARSELIDVLIRTDAKQELLSELLPLQDDSSATTAERVRMGNLFLAASSYDRAAAIFRAVLRQHPGEADAYAGLGESALQRGNFNTARADFAQAARLAPTDIRIAPRLAVADSAIALDPTQRGLGASAELDRASRLLRRTIASVRSCIAVTSSEERTAALDSAEKSLAAVPRGADVARATEAHIALAGELWRLRAPDCVVGTTPDNEVLALVQSRIAQ